ncbi:hypothetical protein JR316_0008632 [Psilocybe cubensis]|uniref:Uncharacterized protein n=2 Tax=Psilocybe cubensis TaxID=181762 RepID=A0A8H8CJZ8_PSICU|nr:hypothetical protein JR316_0008632 [Psilocybe cubensis]KAH9478179.1 hypothetical protein JR316_0008632 [Psilocybe cubensis]
MAQSNIEKARELRFVSSDVNVLVLPIIFRHVVMVLPEHVNRFTTTLLPKRKNFIPALRSKLHTMPRLLSSYKVDTWVFVVNDRRPSLESALASIAPVFVGLSRLVITGQNLSSNAFWLRQHAIHPSIMLLVHYGSPHLVNFYDPIFKSVTHLYTCITHGHRYSTIADLASLTHLAVSTRPDLTETTARNVAASLTAILQTCTNITSLILVMDLAGTDDFRYRMWTTWLKACLEDQRFLFLPQYQPPRMEWSSIVNGRKTLWDRADEWRRLSEISEPMRSKLMRQLVIQNEKERMAFPPPGDRREEEWEIDLVQRDNYHSQADDPDLRGGTGFISAFG